MRKMEAIGTPHFLTLHPFNIVKIGRFKTNIINIAKNSAYGFSPNTAITTSGFFIITPCENSTDPPDSMITQLMLRICFLPQENQHYLIQHLLRYCPSPHLIHDIYCCITDNEKVLARI